MSAEKTEAEKTTEYSPAPREIVATIFDLWKQDEKFMAQPYAKILAAIKTAKADDGWVLSEKRLKHVMKEFNLQPTTTQNQEPTFLKDTVSTLVPNRQYPAGTAARMSKGRGKAIFATKNFKAGEHIWEEKPLLPPADVDMLTLKRKGRSCGYCSKLINVLPDGKPLPRTGVACIRCTVNWCSNGCKREDTGHADSYHWTPKSKINSRAYSSYEMYCLENQLTAAYICGSYFLHKLKNGNNSNFASVMRGMASVRQDVKAASVMKADSFEYEQYIELLRGAHKLLAAALQQVYTLSFEEYLTALGTININNVENCMFEFYAHLNHSCEPNISFKFKSDSRADGIVVTAKTDISAGEELTTTYVDPSKSLEDRQTLLRHNWGFNCGCKRCKREKQLLENREEKGAPKSVLKTSTSPKVPQGKSVRFESSVAA